MKNDFLKEFQSKMWICLNFMNCIENEDENSH